MSTLDRLNNYVRGSATLKLVGVGLLALILLIPASMIDGLISERQRLRDQAVNDIASKWGAEQRLAGPVLEVPYTEEITLKDGSITFRNRSAYFLPDQLNINGNTRSEERYRGIYVAVLYAGSLNITGSFDSLALDQLGLEASTLDWSRAALTFGVSDLRGIDSLSLLQTSGFASTETPRTLAFEPGTPSLSLVQSGFHCPLRLDQAPSNFDFAFELELRGSSAMTFTPLAAATQVDVQSDWGTPKFMGAFLPDQREVRDDGFSASWNVLEVNRPFAQQGTRNGSGPLLGDQLIKYADGVYRTPGESQNASTYSGYDFGIRFLLPVDEYRKIERSAKYSALFIAATFLTFFFIEVLNRRRLHPVQYLLVGFAVVLFYVLLLSLSEHIGFDRAYGVSVALILGLVTAYSASVLRNRKLTFLVAGVLATLYIFFYSLLQLEDYSLLIGSFGLLLALATVMYLTRRTDWYRLGLEPEG